MIRRAALLVAAFAGATPCLAQQAVEDQPTTRIHIQTDEVTTPDVALSPDGSWIAFNLLGHIFRLPVEGGVAEQLTFGPSFDDDPAISPDGRQIAFVSDRDGSSGNLFVLDLSTGRVRRAADESWVDHPVWSPDGQWILFIRRLGARYICLSGDSEVARVPARGGAAETLSPKPDRYEAVAALPDGSMVWSVLVDSPGFHSADSRTAYRQRLPDGQIVELGSVAGLAFGHRIVEFPDRVFVRLRRTPIRNAAMEHEEILAVDLRDGSEDYPVIGLPPAKENCGARTYRFDVAEDGTRVYTGEGGALWVAESGLRTRIPFTADVAFDRLAGSARDLSGQPPLAPPERPTLYHPDLSPDGRSIVFGALGRVWVQTSPTTPAEPISSDDRLAAFPMFSPDGKRVVFVSGATEGEELRIHDLASGATSTLIRGEILRQPTWSPDGRVVFVADWREFGGGYWVSRVPLDAPALEEMVRVGGWRPHPQPLAGEYLYTTSDGVFRRLEANDDTVARRVASAELAASNAQLSPDGTVLLFRRNSEIWVADVQDGAAIPQSVRRLNPFGGRHVRFTPGGDAVVYAERDRIWIQPLDGRPRTEVPVRLEPQPEVPRSILVRDVRILDFRSGEFGAPSSFMVEGGRIVAMGPDLAAPAGAEVLDAGGRFAIPGLIEMHAHSGALGGLAWRGALPFGVTSVRDLGSELFWMNAVAERVSLSPFPAPRLFAAGPIIEGPGGGYGDFFVRVRDRGEARIVVQDLAASRARFAKLYVTLSWDLHDLMATEATRLGIPVVTHGMSMEEIVRCALFLCASVEHSPLEMDGDVWALLAETGIAWVPTAAFGRTPYADFLRRRFEQDLLTDAFLRLATPADLRFLGRLNGVMPTATVEEVAMAEQRLLRRAAEAGVRLATGGDAGNVTTPVGPSVHWELHAMQDAGIVPIQALRAATLDAAIVLGSQDDLGSLEVGKLADFVLLDENPLEDVRNVRSIWRVGRGGWLFDPDELLPR